MLRGILRAHPFATSCVEFAPNGLTLVSGDEGGWVFWWDLLSRRPLAIFRPHEKALVTVRLWYKDDGTLCLLTHGRDNKLYIFHLKSGEQYSTALPSGDDSGAQWKKPWMVHSQDVNALNFCPCEVQISKEGVVKYLAVPSTLDSDKIDIYSISDGGLTRPFQGIGPVIPDGDPKSGIVMSITFMNHILVAGFESGHVWAFDLVTGDSVYLVRAHKQPVLSICSFQDQAVSAAADKYLATHNIAEKTFQKNNINHNGNSAVRIRGDGKLLAVSSWDGTISTFAYPEIVLQETLDYQCSTISFSPTDPTTPAQSTESSNSRSLVDVKRQQLQSTSMLAVAAKDGRVPLFTLKNAVVS
uniref:ASTRA-associated protein 1 n=1 Tax=Blastobotrys adeninivorans TaxID=409370 RepID=A0A060TBH1_BLAAD